MSTYKNLFIAIFNSCWSAIIAFSLIPIYVKFLGLESYAIISLYATLNVFLQIFDFGIYPTIIRETAQSLKEDSNKKFKKTIQTFFIINITVSFIFFLISFYFSDIIAKYWLNSSSLPLDVVSNCIFLIGILISSRWPILIFQGILYGSNFAAYGFIINIIMVTFSALGSVVLLIFYSNDIEHFFIWQIFSGILYTIIIFLFCKRKTQIKFWGEVQLKDFKNGLYLSSSLWLVTASGILFSSSDKLLLSHLLSLDKYGMYMLAVSSATILQIIVNPFYNIFYPKFSKLYIQNKVVEINNLYRLLIKLMCFILLPMGLFIITTSEILIYLWTQDSKLTSLINPIFNFILLASVFNGITFIPYILQLSFAKNWIPLTLNILFTIINVPLIMFLLDYYGLLGAGIAFLIIQVLCFIINP
ncbi:oligosaccharide flippase family protein, partial [Alphaproteobacteria bacterium]|nr:oligosaccharide flippase family protein [Alphaproteobacteria bacterium]